MGKFASGTAAVKRPAPHPQKWASDVVRASYHLPAVVKHVWRIISEFDSGRGCWATPATLARCVGISVDEFTVCLAYLEQVRLVLTVKTTFTIFYPAPPSDFP